MCDTWLLLVELLLLLTVLVYSCTLLAAIFERILRRGKNYSKDEALELSRSNPYLDLLLISAIIRVQMKNVEDLLKIVPIQHNNGGTDDNALKTMH